jgi:uncharacterized lipoprotein YddW (UPF0748 family)
MVALVLSKRLLRRVFVYLLIGLLCAIYFDRPEPSHSQGNYPEIRGVWITNNDTADFLDQNKTQQAVNLLADLNFNTLYPVVWNSGYVLYESAIAQREGLQPFNPRGYQGQDALADLITKAHQRGLLVLPWFEFGFMAPPMSELVTNHPRWFTQRQDGSKTSVTAAGEVAWLNPFHPQVQQFITDLVMEVVNKYDIDGIQFDDHLALPKEFGYDPYTIALYQQETKKAPPQDPQDWGWVRWRANKITAFVAQLNKTIKAQKPNILFSLSPATYRLAYGTYLQDWLDWVRKGLLDEVIVQVYRTELASFVEPIQRPEFQEAKAKVPTAVGILTGLKRKQVTMPLVSEKVRVAKNNGLGVAFFYYKTLWEVAPEPAPQRQAELRALFTTPAPRSLAQKFVPTPTIPNNPNVPPSKAPRFPPQSFPKNPPPRDNFPPAPTLDSFPPEPTLEPSNPQSGYDDFPPEPPL